MNVEAKNDFRFKQPEVTSVILILIALYECVEIDVLSTGYTETTLYGTAPPPTPDARESARVPRREYVVLQSIYTHRAHSCSP